MTLILFLVQLVLYIRQQLLFAAVESVPRAVLLRLEDGRSNVGQISIEVPIPVCYGVFEVVPHGTQLFEVGLIIRSLRTHLVAGLRILYTALLRFGLPS